MIRVAEWQPRHQLVLGDLVAGSRVRDLTLVLGYAGLVGLLAQVSIRVPITPVPVTGQTFAVLLGGLAVGTRRAVAGMCLYLLLGLAGLPWFAGGSGGWSVATTPSFGYIIGFILAALVLGRLATLGFDRHPAGVLAAVVIGNLLIYLLGATWLAVDLHLNAGQAIALGVSPFLIGDAIKALLAMGLLPGAWRIAGGGPRASSPQAQ